MIEHRFSNTSHEAFDDGWGSIEQDSTEEPGPPSTEIIEEHVKSIVSSNDSPDISFDLTINPYRGCEHGCVYCFARPTHSYLNMSPGLDFETRIIAKVNAAERLRAAFSRRSYQPKLLNIGAATDAYQPVERKLKITRAVIDVLSEARHPFSLVTKSSGVERDLDLIAPMAAQRLAAIYVSVTSLDGSLARILEPRAAAPQRRLRTIEALARAGVPVGVSVSPIIPFINEPEIGPATDGIHRIRIETGDRRSVSYFNGVDFAQRIAHLYGIHQRALAAQQRANEQQVFQLQVDILRPDTVTRFLNGGL